MNKTVVIHQPDFMPYLGFFHRFLHADAWVVLDQVQFLRNSKSWHHRDKIKTPQGERWLTVEIKKCHQKTPINHVLLAETNWRKDHLNLITGNYHKSGYFREIMPHIEELYSLRSERLVDFNLQSIEMLLRLLGIEIPSVMASGLNPKGTSNELLVDLLKSVGATRYLSGVGAKDYYDAAPFEQAGITVTWQEFEHPIYPQLHGDFIPYMSSIDLLLNCGIEASRRILRSIKANS
jgi:hypothetical protein